MELLSEQTKSCGAKSHPEPGDTAMKTRPDIGTEPAASFGVWALGYSWQRSSCDRLAEAIPSPKNIPLRSINPPLLTWAF